MSYPVHYQVDRPPVFSRAQLLARVVAFCALGVLGISFGAVFAFLYLALPVFAASRLSGGDADTYGSEDGPQVLRMLRWFAAIAAWAGLIAERLPRHDADEIVHLRMEAAPVRLRPGAVLARVVTGLPSAVVLALLGWLGVLVWLWGAFSVLVSERVGTTAFHYLEGLQRWSIRLLVYQAGLVEEYPPFSFADPMPGVLPPARVAE